MKAVTVIAVIALLLSIFSFAAFVKEYTGGGKFASASSLRVARSATMSRVQSVAKRAALAESTIGVLSARVMVSNGDTDKAREELEAAKARAAKGLGEKRKSEILGAFDEAISGLDSRSSKARLAAVDRLVEVLGTVVVPRPKTQAEETEPAAQ